MLRSSLSYSNPVKRGSRWNSWIYCICLGLSGCWIQGELNGATAPASVADSGKPIAKGDWEPDAYRSTSSSNAIDFLQKRLNKHEITLPYDPRHGYLDALLSELKLPSASQVLVASKTSPNKSRISPKNPRAIYYNDAMALAYVPGADWIEIAVSDPRLGTAYYTLKQSSTTSPSFVRDDRCLECHASSKTLDIPGWLIRSFATQEDGDVDVLSGLMVDHRTPLEDRWGGYYVTGDVGNQRHRGNQFGADSPISAIRNQRSPAPLWDLRSTLDIFRFPEPTSDVVALMVLEHQVHGLNLLTRFHRVMDQIGESEDLSRAKSISEAVLAYFFFSGEATIKAPIHGAPSFVQSFVPQGPKDSRGRSLRELDCQKRLFKYPFSYLIYSPSFDALPARAKKHFYHRVWEVLSGEDASGDFSGVTSDQKTAIREILIDTKKDLPAYWRL